MPVKDQHEQKFFKALSDIFVGAKIEGDSGFINLMAIKSRYYQTGVFPLLKKDIDEALIAFPEFREELFDKLYTFFQRYFSESGSIYFRYTSLNQNVYEKVYTDDRDVILFWKTHMLYYVKTDRIFRSVNVEVEGTKFFFDASKMALKKANEKRDVIYAFRKLQGDDGTLVFDVDYSERGRVTKVDEILKETRKAGHALNEDTLSQAFRIFEKQSEVDFFINKDARSFLQEQFDLWLYQYLFDGQNIWSAERIAQLQALKEIAYKVIAFISQFEDELVKVWNKPKFVLNSHYVLTLDKLISSSVFEKLLKHPNFPQQVKEWQELGMLEKSFRAEMLAEKDLTGEMIHIQYRYLPVDTKFFPDLVLEILAQFESLDIALDGWLVHSENYQALNSISHKFWGKSSVIYIDPPYNATTTEIDYENTYKHSSWLSFLSDRINISCGLLKKMGVNIIAIDENEQENLGLFLKSRFAESQITCVTVVHNPSGQQGDNFSYCHDYAYFIYPKGKRSIGHDLRSDDTADIRNFRDVTGEDSLRGSAKNCFFPVLVKDGEIVGFGEVSDDNYHPGSPNIFRDNGVVEIYPIDPQGVERKWRFARQTVETIRSELRVKYIEQRKVWDIQRTKVSFNFKTVWSDSKYSANNHGSQLLNHIIGSNSFTFPKSVFTVEDSLRAGLNDSRSGIILDYFAGSGTTAHAVMNLNREDGGNRKYILVEMGEHFNTVILPRIKKVAFNSKWKDGKPVFAKGEAGISHFVKYYDLEQYEDVLKRAKYEDSTLFENPSADPYHSYVFLRDLKMLDSVEIDREENQVHFHPERLYPDQGKPNGTSIDLAETLSQRTGKWIKSITADYVEFEDGERMSLTDPDWQTIKPMVWWQ